MTRIASIVALIFAAVGLSADAAPCNNSPVCNNRVQVVAAAPILLPSYYPVQGNYGQAQLQEDVLRQILEELKSIREELGGRIGGGGLSLEVVAQQACASCHSEGKNPKGGFIMVGKDGKVNPLLTLADKKLIALRVQTDDPKIKMPPEKKLTPSAIKVVTEAVKP